MRVKTKKVTRKENIYNLSRKVRRQAPWKIKDIGQMVFQIHNFGNIERRYLSGIS